MVWFYDLYFLAVLNKVFSFLPNQIHPYQLIVQPNNQTTIHSRHHHYHHLYGHRLIIMVLSIIKCWLMPGWWLFGCWIFACPAGWLVRLMVVSVFILLKNKKQLQQNCKHLVATNEKNVKNTEINVWKLLQHLAEVLTVSKQK